jgi:hypothetical protein
MFLARRGGLRRIMERMKGFQADFFNGWEEDGEPVPILKKSIVIGTKIEEKNLWKRIREFLRRK